MTGRQKKRLHISTTRQCYDAASAAAEREGKARTDIVTEAITRMFEALEAGTLQVDLPDDMVQWQMTASPKTQRQLQQLKKKLDLSRSEVVSHALERHIGRPLRD